MLSTYSIASFTDPSQQKSDFTDLTGSLGNAFAASTPVPMNASPGGDDPQAIERAEEWLYSERSPDAAGDDRFPTTVAIAIVLREHFGLSELASARELVERWNWFGCTPRLDQRDIERAVHLAYSDPTAALELVTRQGGREQALQPLQSGPRDALAPLDDGADTTVAPQPVGHIEPLADGEADLPVKRETRPVELKTGTVDLAAYDTSAKPDADLYPVDRAAEQVLVVELDQCGGGKETLLKLQAAGKDCPMAKTMTARSSNRTLRFIHSLPPDTRVMEGVIGRGIKVFGCNESAALEGFEIINDQALASPPKSVSARFTTPNVSVTTKTTEKVARSSDELVITKNPRKVGRPPGRTKDKLFQMRVGDAFMTQIDDWRRLQSDFPNRTESVRRLVEQALGRRQPE